MPRHLIFPAMLITLVALSLPAFAFQAKKTLKASGQSSQLLGTWEASEEGEAVRLIFKTESLLEFEGEESSYKILQGVIRVSDPFEGDMDYPYSLRGDVLVLTFPEGDQLEFHRIKGGQAAAPADRSEKKASSTAASEKNEGSRENHLLVGKFMSYSSASSSTGSSSWTQYVTFDGVGNFEWNSESAHSARQYDQTGSQTGSGLAYGSDGGNRGKYRVVGNRIIATFPDGSQGEGVVTERFQDGSIGAFKFDGKTYAR